MDIEIYLKERCELIDLYLKSYFSVPLKPFVLHEAMTYSLFAGGKRIRPILCLASYEACGGRANDIIPYAAALELIHTYSLVHDDLPAMDNDDMRRGKPTSHKVFGEAIAILTGDALLTEAFSMLTNPSSNKDSPPPSPPPSRGRVRVGVFSHKEMNPSTLIKVISEVAVAAGIRGMVAGQAQDILSENSEPDIETLAFIHLHKTAALITASVRIGPILANSDEDTLMALTKYGKDIGLTFQIIDDILNIEGNREELGKPSGSDEKMKKITYPALFGIEKSRQKAEALISEAIDALKIFSSEAEPLREIALYLAKRRT